MESKLHGPWFLLRDIPSAACPICGATVNGQYRSLHIEWHLEQQKFVPDQKADELAWPEPGDSQ